MKIYKSALHTLYRFFLCVPFFLLADEKGGQSGQCYQRGFPLASATSGYNAPAEIQLRDRWEVYSSASFLYWLAEEEGLDLAIGAALVSGQVSVPPMSNTLFQDFEFNPGFKIGLGFETGLDDWMVNAGYTWLHQTTTTSSNASPTPFGVGVWFISNWFIQPNGFGQTLSATSLQSKWHLGLDLADLYLSRAFYQGTHVTINPFAGLRGAWIRQSLTIDAADPQGPSGSTTSRTRSKSWGVGPRGGLEGRWLLPIGFRFESDFAISILYTRYTSVYHNEDQITSNTIPVAANFMNYGCLRTVNEMNLGFGWSQYIERQNIAVDVLLAYDFAVFWNQNLLRRLVDLETNQDNASPSNLYLSGLTAKLRFDY